MRGSKGLIGKERVGRWGYGYGWRGSGKESFIWKALFFIYEIKKIKEQAVIVKTCSFIFLTIFNCTLYHLYDLCIPVIDISSGF